MAYICIFSKFCLLQGRGGLLQRRRQRKRGCCCCGVGRVGRLPGGAGRAAPRGLHTQANLHELASIIEECTQTCCCRACWNGTGIARNRASWNGSGRNMHKYAGNIQKTQEICSYMHKISIGMSEKFKEYAVQT